jgi:tetratricopeptide (TPR) repeat protein
VAVADPASAAAERRSDPRSRLAGLAVAGLCLAAAVSFALPWLSERELEKATAAWRDNPEAAYERLDRAAGLNPVSARPLLVEGTIAILLRQPQRAEAAFLDVLEREPRNQYAWLHLAALASARQDRVLARRRIERAAALAPRDEATRQVREALSNGLRVTPQGALNRVLKYSRDTTDRP